MSSGTAPARVPGDQAGQPSHIVCVGASAGGLRPLQIFFERMGETSGMAFVVIQHLSPDFKSLMGDLLLRHTRMAIHSVEDGMLIVSNAVYLIPPGTQMTVAHGRLYLVQRVKQDHVVLPIDIFLHSLAEDYGDRAIAVILSGAGSDGSMGIQAVAAAGGLVVVQSPETAQFDSMPRNAITTGVVDVVLGPEDIPVALTNYSDNPGSILALARTLAQMDVSGEGGDHHVAQIFFFLRSRWGVDFANYKPTTIGRGIERRMAMHKISQISEYVSMLAADPEEVAALYRDLLIHVTEFFRNPEAFRVLETQVIPAIFRHKNNNDDIRVWVSGCATGEEAYSVAMLLHEHSLKLNAVNKITVFATDLHRPSLSFASQGIYPVETLHNLSPERRAVYVQEDSGGYYKVSPELRKLVVFAPQNLINDPPFTRIDLATCRNLLIYFKPPVQEKVIASLHFSLRSDGFLFLGSSEGIGRLSGEFEPVDSHWKIFRKARDTRLPLDMVARDMPATATITQTASLTMPRSMVGIDRQLMNDYDRLLDRYMPCGVLLDPQYRPIHYFGDVARYLRHARGRPENDILRMTDSSLSLALNSILQRAAKADQPTTMKGVQVGTADGDRYVDITIERLSDPRTRIDHFIVTFAELPITPTTASRSDPEDDTTISVDTASTDTFVPTDSWRHRVDDLEQELSFTRENLQATIEEFQTSNEELQSTNEELLAANEELQSTNEELQSVNEELFTVNAEFELRNKDLKDLNRDYDDLIRSTRVALVFLDRDLQIRRYSPMIEGFFDLRPFDMGRPIASIAYKLDGQAELLADLQVVATGGATVMREVRGQNERWFQLRVRPFLNEAQERLGVVLMYIDISELKQAQERALLSEQLFQMTIESSLDSFFIYAAVRSIHGEIIDFQVLETNSVGASHFGLARDELLGRRISEVLDSPASSAQMIHDYQMVMESGVPLIREFESEMNGRHRWLRQQVVIVGDGVAVTSSDISDRKTFELKLKAQQERLDMALSGGSLGTWDSEFSSGRMTLDDRALIFFGLNPSEIEETLAFWNARIHIDDRSHAREVFSQYMAGNSHILETELRMRHRDGSWRWISSRGRAVERDPTGVPLRMAGTYQDITERVQAEAQLRESNRRYQTLSETSPVGIFRTDATGSCIYVNPRWREIVGISSAEALGDGWMRGLHPDDAATVVAAWVAAIETRADFQREFRFLQRNGTVRWALSQAVPEIDEVGQLVGYVGTVIDIGQRIAAEETLRRQSAQLETANAELAQAARLKDQFLANMSHELRTPLTGVIGFGEALAQGIYGDLNDAQKRATQHIFDNGQHLLSLINDILDLARIGAGHVEIKLGPVSIDTICAEVIDMIAPMARAKDQRISYTHPPADVIIEADVLRLRQILINLLSNAVKFTPDGGEFGVTVELDAGRSEVCFVVWDHGIGISLAHQPLLFQPFVQLDSRLARAQPGTGLGLSLVRQLTTLHGGSVHLSSVLGEGSTFTVRLPLRQRPDLYDLPARQMVRVPATEGRPLILLAEDDHSVSTLLHDYLSTQGYTLMHIDRGEHVLSLLHGIRPQLAMIDIQLPGTSGLEIIARLRADPDPQIARTPVIAVTALAMLGDHERCLAAGANDYLSKPIRLDELSVVVARVLSGGRG